MKNKKEPIHNMESKYIFGKITPLVIAKNTIIKPVMTEQEYRLVHDVSEKWIEWIKKNCDFKKNEKKIISKL